MKTLYAFSVLFFLVVSACSRESDKESMASVGGRWTCNIEKQYDCTRDGCVPRNPRIVIVIDFDKGKFSRCTGSVCDSYLFQVYEDPLVSVLVGKMDRARGAHFSVDKDGTNFVESVSQGAWTKSSFGNCEPEIMKE
jgi:hypothetical protein